MGHGVRTGLQTQRTRQCSKWLSVKRENKNKTNKQKGKRALASTTLGKRVVITSVCGFSIRARYSDGDGCISL